jgi:penicillin-binding protein 1A
MAVLLPIVAGAVALGVFLEDPQLVLSCNLHSPQSAIGEDTLVFASDRTPLGVVPTSSNREWVPIARISPFLAKATVAIEDRRFWSRSTALDPESIVRAAYADVKAGRAVQGGSTITQQLVRDRYLTHDRRLTIARKLKEACLAGEVAHRMSKRAILQAYLNGVFYGHHAYGAEAASQTYFSRPARDLTLDQAALLAGLPQAPSVYDPVGRKRLAQRRRNDVLAAMRSTGAISRAEYRAATARPLRLEPSSRYTAIRSGGFFGFARRELIRRYGHSRTRRGGLRVRTTLDPRLQHEAIAAIRQWLSLGSDPAGALVAIDPANGAVRAMAAIAPGRPPLDFNLATQSRRQAGSSFKTFTLTAAMEAGIPLTSVWNGPPSMTITDRRCLNANGNWVVHNYADEGRGTMSLLQATAFSVNTIFAQVALKVGPMQVVDAAHRLGIESPLKPVCSITLGPEGVSPLEMTDAFATLAARGVRHRAEALSEVRSPAGRSLLPPAHGTRVISRKVADQVTYALSGVVLGGTGTAANIGRPAAGKTGTAESFKDAWFCGFVPQLAACVWVGHPQAEIPLGTVDGFAQVVGGSIPARIWHDFMGPALQRSAPLPLPAPRTASLGPPPQPGAAPRTTSLGAPPQPAAPPGR